MEYLMNYWREITAARQNAKENMYAEGGPLKPDELQGNFIKFYFYRHNYRTLKSHD